MSQASSNPTAGTAVHDAHPAHLAHHYDTPQQQYQAAKVGMWIFLATEILMFGGLFCAYAVYRHNHPDVFEYAHQYLDRTLGAVNTVILIASSFTMAWAVRCVQLNRQKAMMILMGLTILGGAGFMCIKAVEYHAKWKHHLWIGTANRYSIKYQGPKEAEEGHSATPAIATTTTPATAPAQAIQQWPQSIDPNAGTADEPKIKPRIPVRTAMVTEVSESHPHVESPEYPTRQRDRERIATFFSIYFVMTGLHGIHVLVGMGLIGWVMTKASKGIFGPAYFTPVDLAGLYWHLVDLIWIFLFPLLYLIH